MAMPTTRRGRYLLYRSRAQIRKKREETRRPASNGTSGRKTCRNRAYSLWGKQAPKTYPRYIYDDYTWDWETPAAWITPPSRGVFGVIRDRMQMAPYAPYPYHLRFGVIGYQWRRVLSMPRTKHLPWNPYLFPREALTPADFWSLPLYPSGAPSYAARQGWI